MNATNDRLVSVVIPVYNGAPFLAETLASVAAQSYRPLEVILVDDGSTDGSDQIVAAAQARLDIPIRYFAQPNRGVSVARNRAVAEAQGAYVAFLDADDLWLPEKTARQVAFLHENPQSAGVVCRLDYFLADGATWPAQLNRAHYEQQPAAYLPSALLVRRETLARVGPFDPALRTGEDTDWFFRARDAGLTISLLAEVLLQRRFHQTNLSYTPGAPAQDLLRIIRSSLRRGAQ